MRNRLFFALLIFVCFSCRSFSQDSSHRLYDATPHFGLKSNILYDIAGFNLGAEFKLNRRYTIDLSVNYNPFTFNDNRKWKHLLVQPELRYWLCESFSGHFLGLHTHFAEYNIGNINVFPGTRDHRYRGWLGGFGFSYGYQWLLSDRWSMEAVLGAGYAHLDYSKYECASCGELISKQHRNYIGVTKAALTLIYIIK